MGALTSVFDFSALHEAVLGEISEASIESAWPEKNLTAGEARHIIGDAQSVAGSFPESRENVDVC